MARPKKQAQPVQLVEPAKNEGDEVREVAAEHGVKVLDLKKDLFTKRHAVKLLNVTQDKLVFQSVGTGSILVTDHYGVGGGKQRIFYDVQPRQAKAMKFSTGDSVYILRVLAKGRKVFFGRVVSREPNGNIVVDLADRDFFPMGSKRNFGKTGYKIFPASMLFKKPDEISDYADAMKRDLEIARTQHRRTLESGGVAHHA